MGEEWFSIPSPILKIIFIPALRETRAEVGISRWGAFPYTLHFSFNITMHVKITQLGKKNYKIENHHKFRLKSNISQNKSNSYQMQLN